MSNYQWNSTTNTGSFNVLWNQGGFSGPSAINDSVSVTVKDNANTLTGTATQTVVVTPIAPTVTWTSDPSSANEGQTVLYTFSVTDPDILDTLSYASTYPSATDGTVTLPIITATATTTTANATGSFDVTFLSPRPDQFARESLGRGHPDDLEQRTAEPAGRHGGCHHAYGHFERRHGRQRGRHEDLYDHRHRSGTARRHFCLPNHHH